MTNEEMLKALTDMEYKLDKLVTEQRTLTVQIEDTKKQIEWLQDNLQARQLELPFDDKRMSDSFVKKSYL